MTSLFDKKLIREIFSLEEALDEYANDTFISEELAKCSAAPGKLLGCFRASAMGDRVRLISRCIGNAMKMKMDFVQALSADENDPECPEDAVRILLSSAIDATNVSRGIDDFVDPTEDLRTVFDFGAYRNILNATTGLMTALSSFADGDILAKYLMDGCLINVMLIRRALMILNKPAELNDDHFDAIDRLMYAELSLEDYVKVFNYDLNMDTPPELIIKHDHQVAFNEEEKAAIRAREEAKRKEAEEKAKLEQMQKEMTEFKDQLLNAIAYCRKNAINDHIASMVIPLKNIAETCTTSLESYNAALALRRFFSDFTENDPSRMGQAILELSKLETVVTVSTKELKNEDFSKLRQILNVRFKRHDTMDYVDTGDVNIVCEQGCSVMVGYNA